jgi:asparagine synthase (glutamine-hydrolysing)
VRGAWGGRSRDVGPAVRFLKPHRRPSQDQRRNEHSLPPGSRAFSIAFMTTPKHVWWPDPVLQWGIEYRDPTADRRLLERLLRYPQAAFRLGGRPRGLARELAVDLLPERVRLRRTQGAQVPEAPALIGVHAGRYRAELARMAGSTWCRELLDLPALGRCVDRFAAGSTDYYAALPVDRAMDVGQFLAGLEGGS